MTHQLFQLPRPTAISSNLTLVSGAKVRFFLTGTSTPTNTWQDAARTTLHANPVVADSAGRLPTVYLDPSIQYRITFTDSSDVEIYPAIDPVNDLVLSQAVIGGYLFPRTAAEIAAGVTPTNYGYEPGDVRRYGAVLDGATDDTAALNRWASVLGRHTFPVSQTALITASVTPVSNSNYEFVEGATIQTATQNISMFAASSKTKIVVRGAKFKQTSAGNTGGIGAVALTDCSYCEIHGCEFEGMQSNGVFLTGATTQCKIIGNYFHDFLNSTAGDKADIYVYQNSSYNTVQGNRCYGGQYAIHGIAVQDPGGVGTYLPQHNKVINNWVGDHIGYGIMVYIGGSQESHNHVIGNTVQNITGTHLTGQSGTGIYCVGNGLGGLKVHDNTIRNCCSATTSAINGPGGVTITDTPTGSIRISVCGNTVEHMTQGHGILISGALGGAVVESNCIRLPSTNDGTGAGGAGLAGNCLRVVNSNNVTVTANECLHNGPQDCILVYATDTDHKNIVLSANGCVSAAGNPIRVARDAAWTHTNVTIEGNTGETTSNTPNVIQVSGVDRCTITGNSGGCGSQPAISLTATLNTRLANNSMNTTGATAVSTNGTCTGSLYDRSNQIPGAFSNGGTGFTFEKLLTGSATYDPPSLADGDGGTTTVTVTGATTGERAFATFSNDLSGIILHAWVSSADTVSVRFQNETGGVVDLASGTLRAYVIKN